MTPRRTVVHALLAYALFLGTAYGQAPALDAPARAHVVDALAQKLNDFYVFPEVGTKIVNAIRARQTKGSYDEITDAKVFADVLTADLQEAGNDKHLRVIASDTPRSPRAEQTQEERNEMRKEMIARGYGVAKVDILPGNIGYLDLRSFDPVGEAGPAITAAMTKLAASDALIVDMRNNGGGDPAAVAHLSSYLFDQRTHLNNLYWREGDRTDEFWTNDHVLGKRFGEKKAVYVLIGPRTFSAAEEFSYNLKQLKRATLVGEATGGGANPGRWQELSPYLAAFIPNGRAINPITKTNWEGSGVSPDLGVPATEALATAHKLALKNIAAAVADPHRAAQLRTMISQVHP
jgi:C-terminal processing protease CtpA/Prc